ncbi:MAG: polymer-forming cytoskeletal protein [Oscillospiraceae bacterium]|nr:polymer-forming cytoskeletal protein [Oscillospiraceae bacterium]
MEKKNPFKAAINELIGAQDDVSPVSTLGTAPDSNLAEELIEPEQLSAAGTDENENTVPFRSAGPSALITEDVVIDGSISAERDMLFAGTIRGNVRCEGKLTVQGRIEGDVTAGEVSMISAKVRGKTICQGQLIMDEHSIVVGDIESDEAVLSGKVNGDIHTNGNIDIRATALVVGDLEFGTVSVEHGAAITGKMTTKSADNPSQAFSELI